MDDGRLDLQPIGVVECHTLTIDEWRQDAFLPSTRASELDQINWRAGHCIEINMYSLHQVHGFLDRGGARCGLGVRLNAAVSACAITLGSVVWSVLLASYNTANV